MNQPSQQPQQPTFSTREQQLALRALVRLMAQQAVDAQLKKDIKK